MGIFHINKPPLIVTGNGTTHAEGAFPLDGSARTDGVEVYNSDKTNDVAVYIPRDASDAGVAVFATCQLVPAGQTKTFSKPIECKTASIVFGTTSTAKVYFTPCNAFPSIS